jgi:hypothetical protein
MNRAWLMVFFVALAPAAFAGPKPAVPMLALPVAALGQPLKSEAVVSAADLSRLCRRLL